MFFGSINLLALFTPSLSARIKRETVLVKTHFVFDNIKCNNLPDMDIISTTDAKVRIWCLPLEFYGKYFPMLPGKGLTDDQRRYVFDKETKTINDNLSPTFPDRFEFDMPYHKTATKCGIQVLDKDILWGSQQYIGKDEHFINDSADGISTVHFAAYE
eukprot:Pgem_evm1s551